MIESGKKVLIVEDNPEWRELLARILQRLSCEVFEAITGTEAIDQALGVGPDLILMDFSLPDMDGDEVTGLLKQYPATREVPVVVQTAYISAEHTSRALSAGASEVLQKPVELSLLYDVLQKYLAVEYPPTDRQA